ncbi:hypothetical protein FJZ40_03570 [Candidatus Shapirobacteria bacterium]|nr:hypothetical protein [Candidatus Shapirobacteria bacterium]
MKIFKILIILGILVTTLSVVGRVSPVGAVTGGAVGCVDPRDSTRETICEIGSVIESTNGRVKCVYDYNTRSASWMPAEAGDSLKENCKNYREWSSATAPWYYDPNRVHESLAISKRTGELTGESWLAANISGSIDIGNDFLWGQIAELSSSQTTTSRTGGALGGVGNLIVLMIGTPPAHGTEYLAYVGRKLGIVSPVYAQQGIGFTGLRPLLPIWGAFRNMAYIFFILVFLVMGFAIMFRVKLNPQTAITIQSAIPRVVVALLLVTFSYAIAGFLIDLIYLMIAIVVFVFGQSGFLGDTVAKTQQAFFSASTLDLFGSFLWRGGKAIEDLSSVLNPAAYLPGVLKNILESLFGPISQIPGLNVGSNLMSFVLGIALFFAFFKLFFALLSAYVRILISVIFGPLQIMLNVLPGQDSFLGWLRGLLSNILIFPAVVAMFLLATVLVNATQKYGGALWAPPFLEVGPLKATGNIIGSLIAYGILLMTPKVAEMVNQALSIKPTPYGAAMGEALGPAVGPFAAPFRMGWGATKAGVTSAASKFVSYQVGKRLGIPEEEKETTGEEGRERIKGRPIPAT